MTTALPAVSFMLLILLGLLALFPRIHRDAVRMSLVSWLLLSNLIHGVNAVAWSSNTNIHVPVWCDITTKLLLATTMALPCALLCLACRLEFLASQRPIPSFSAPIHTAGSETEGGSKSTSGRVRMAKLKQLAFELSLCVGFPLVFLFLHFIVQNNRFDITQDLGCSASIHPSTPGLIITSLPPLILCIATFVIGGLAIHHSFLLPHSGFSQHIVDRSEQNFITEKMSSSLFLRRTITIFVLTAIITVFTLFAAFTRSTAVPFSWGNVHEEFSKIHIVKGGDELRFVVLSWWEIPVVSILYVLLEIGIGQEVRDAVKDGSKVVGKKLGEWQQRRNERAVASPKETVLPLHRSSTTTDIIHIQVPLAAIDTRNAVGRKDYVSGWDDMIDLKASPQKPKSKSPTPTESSKSTSSPTASPPRKPLTCPGSPTRSLSSQASNASLTDSSTKARKSCNSPVSARFPVSPSSPRALPSSATPDQSEDVAFAASTMNYLNSPTAQSLGLRSPTSPSPLTLVTPASPSLSSPSPVPIMSPPTVHTSPSKIGYDRTEPPWRFNGRVTPISRGPNASPPPSPPPSSPLPPSQTPTIPRRNREFEIDAMLLVPSRFSDRKAAQNVPDDVESVISSIIEVPWPQPPSTIPRSCVPLSSRPESPASSDTSCITENFARFYEEDRPFRGPSISPVPGETRRTVSPLNLVKKKGSRGILNLQRSKPTTQYGLPPGEAIYMTVVQETL